MRDAYASGKVHIGWATLDMIPLFVEQLRQATRARCRASTSRWTGPTAATASSCRDTIKSVADLRGKTVVLAQNSPVALLPAEHADQRRRAAERSRMQVHAGRVPGRGGVQRRQDDRLRRELGAGHLQPVEGRGQPDARQHADGEQAHRRRVVRARRLREGSTRDHGRARARASSRPWRRSRRRRRRPPSPS